MNGIKPEITFGDKNGTNAGIRRANKNSVEFPRSRKLSCTGYRRTERRATEKWLPAEVGLLHYSSILSRFNSENIIPQYIILVFILFCIYLISFDYKARRSMFGLCRSGTITDQYYYIVIWSLCHDYNAVVVYTISFCYHMEVINAL